MWYPNGSSIHSDVPSLLQCGIRTVGDAVSSKAPWTESGSVHSESIPATRAEPHGVSAFTYVNPASVPLVNLVCASPTPFVTTCAGDRLPGPERTWNESVSPTTRFPNASAT